MRYIYFLSYSQSIIKISKKKSPSSFGRKGKIGFEVNSSNIHSSEQLVQLVQLNKPGNMLSTPAMQEQRIGISPGRAAYPIAT